MEGRETTTGEKIGWWVAFTILVAVAVELLVVVSVLGDHGALSVLALVVAFVVALFLTAQAHFIWNYIHDRRDE